MIVVLRISGVDVDRVSGKVRLLDKSNEDVIGASTDREVSVRRSEYDSIRESTELLRRLEIADTSTEVVWIASDIDDVMPARSSVEDEVNSGVVVVSVGESKTDVRESIELLRELKISDTSIEEVCTASCTDVVRLVRSSAEDVVNKNVVGTSVERSKDDVIKESIELVRELKILDPSIEDVSTTSVTDEVMLARSGADDVVNSDVVGTSEDTSEDDAVKEVNTSRGSSEAVAEEVIATSNDVSEVFMISGIDTVGDTDDNKVLVMSSTDVGMMSDKVVVALRILEKSVVDGMSREEVP